MAVLIDTNVAIRLRDRDPVALGRIGALGGDAMISVVTHVELEGGVYAKPAFVAARRLSLDILMQTLIVLPIENQALIITPDGGRMRVPIHPPNERIDP